MTQTGYVLPHWRRSQVAVEYGPHGKPTDGRGNGGLLSSARDMVCWHRALQRDGVLSRAAKRAMFRPRVPEPGGDSSYAYGWVVVDTRFGRVAWHNGGNAWSYGELTRVLAHGAMVFWLTNRYRNTVAGWNLARRGSEIAEGVVRRLLAG